jgi:hypothetical protein
MVAKMLLDDPDTKPGVVGDMCFDIQFAYFTTSSREENK